LRAESKSGKWLPVLENVNSHLKIGCQCHYLQLDCPHTGLQHCCLDNGIQVRIAFVFEEKKLAFDAIKLTMHTGYVECANGYPLLPSGIDFYLHNYKAQKHMS